MAEKHIITGTSGTGKTSLVNALSERGFQVYAEPTRHILEHQLAIDGPALPAKNPALFIEKMVEFCRQSLNDADCRNAPTFFDRGLPDVVAYATRFGADSTKCLAEVKESNYAKVAFRLPPWQEIFVNDDLRGATFESYAEFDEVIQTAYLQSGFTLVEVPKVSIEDRITFVLDKINYE